MSADQRPSERLVAVQYVPRNANPWNREWFTVRAKSLHEAEQLALKRDDVERVTEVCWDPGYVT